ncbi:NucA/NucB deoxyribonuclease domain-containing protein [Acinetobacter guillouiae]|uniref:NucA/NucB deoxyribonuclease domain-containing protein n=1 Tax=Acinetobacter guillouiae TaxID=106649 RepID=UPI003AF74026
MNKINILILSIFYLLLNNATYAFEQKLQNEESTELKPDTFLGALNTIVVTAHTLESDSESALDVSPACEKVGTGPIDSLNSRTSFCQKFEKEFDIYDSQAQNAYVNTVKITGYAYVEDNPTNELKWPVKFKFRSIYTNPTGPIIHIAPRLGCGTDEQGGINCSTVGNPSVVLNPGLSPEITVNTNMNMYSTSEKEIPMTIEGNYNIVGQSLVDDTAKNFEDNNIPVVRCDVKLAKSNTSGCVFFDAPAVMRTINLTTTPEVRESAEHIRDAQNSGLPGRYVPQEDSILPGYGSQPLKRLRDFAARKANREFSLGICRAQDNTYSETCDPDGDSDDPEVSCQCDEYPFAATQEGGNNSPSPGVSARKILASDNASAGGKLGVFFNQQRVLDGEEFYVNVE